MGQKQSARGLENTQLKEAIIAFRGAEPTLPHFVAFGAPALDEDEIAEVVQTLRSGWIGTGPRTQQFEREFREYVGAQYAIAVNSCTAALHLSLLASDIGNSDEVITTPMTFCATANVILHAGATPIFADIDRRTLNIDPDQIRHRITERTAAIIPVHFGGLPCDMKTISTIAQRHQLAIIEDAAHAVGSRYDGRMIGGSGNAVCFSFYANKNLTTAEGGMVTTNDEVLAAKIEVYRLHGLSRDAWKRYQTKELILSEAIFPGFKANMTDIQASLGIHQLRKLEGFLKVREVYAAAYDDAFRNRDDIILQPRPTDVTVNRHGLHLYVIMLDLDKLTVGRNELVRALRAENVGAGIHYSALHLHPYYRETFGYRPGDFPNAEWVSERILSLPLTPGMTWEDVDGVIRAVTKVLNYYRRPTF